MRPMRGPQMPAQTRTVPAAMRPREVSTARTRPPATSKPVTSVRPMKAAAPADVRAMASAARTALAMPSPGTW